MSMLNQMLRDLEQRKSSDLLIANSPLGQVNATDIQWQERVSSVNPFIRYLVAMLVMFFAGFGAVKLLGTDASKLMSLNMDQSESVSEDLPVVNESFNRFDDRKKQNIEHSVPLTSLKYSEQITTGAKNVQHKDQDVALEYSMAVTPVAKKADVLKEQKEKKTVSSNAVHKKKQIIKTVVADLSAEEKANSLYQEALILLESNNKPAAIDKLKKAISFSNENVAIRLLLIQLYLQSSNILTAEYLIDEGLALHPENIDLLMEKSSLFFQREEFSSALNLIQPVTVAVESASDFYAYKASVLRKNGLFSDAIALYKKLLLIKPAQAQWWAGLAITLESVHQIEESLSAYKKAQQFGSLQEPLNHYVDSRIVKLQEKQLHFSR